MADLADRTDFPISLKTINRLFFAIYFESQANFFVPNAALEKFQCGLTKNTCVVKIVPEGGSDPLGNQGTVAEMH